MPAYERTYSFSEVWKAEVGRGKADSLIVGRRPGSQLPVILSLAGPTMLEHLMDTAVQYIDTAMVGSLGTAATAAVGCTSTVNWLVGSTVAAVGIGFLSYISKALGAGDKDRAGRASTQAVIAALVLGLVFTVLTLSLARFVPVWMKADESIRDTAALYFAILYSPMLFRSAKIIFGTVLRSAGDSKTPMKVGIAVNLINVLMNFLLIYPARSVVLFSRRVTVFGAGLGVTGAAIASALAFIFGGVAITVALYRHKILSPKGRRFAPDAEILGPCLRVALPNMLQRFCTSLGYVVFASMINSLGEISTAAHTIANTVESAFYIPGYGMQAAAATLTGNCIGARDEERLKRVSRSIVLLEVAMMIISGGLLFIFAPQMVSLFSSDPSVITLGSTVLRMVALSEPFYGISIVTEGMLQGAGMTKLPFVFNVICMWGIRIIGTLLCISVGGYGLVSAWVCMIADNMALLVLFRIYWRRLRSRGELFML